MESRLIKHRNSDVLPQREPLLTNRPKVSKPATRQLRNIFLPDSPQTPQAQLHPKLEFFDTYKNFSRIRERLDLKQTCSTPTLGLLSQVHKKQLRPLPLGLLSAKGEEKDINLTRYRLSDDYAAALSSGLKRHYSVEKLSLQGSRLNERSSATILKNIHSPHLKHLDLAENRLGSESITCLIRLISDNASELRHINLEATGLSQDNARRLCEALHTNSRVTHLNLAKNSLKDAAGQALGKMLCENSTLTALDLHWNMLSQTGAKGLFEGLAENDALLQLDLSWNCLGTNADEMISAMTTFVTENKRLRHLDISCNKLSPSHCEQLAQAFTLNQTILGVHVKGNACTVDSLGFLQVTTTVEMSMSAFSSRRILANQKSVPGEMCWVCEKWSEAYIAIPANGQLQGPLYLHTQLENFQPMLMEKEENHYVIRRALPYRQVQVFFSDHFGNTHTLPIYAVSRLPSAQTWNLTYPSGQAWPVTCEQVNLLQAEGAECDIEDAFEVVPRPAVQVPVIEVAEEVVDACLPSERNRKPTWSFETSIFKDYVLDTPELLDQCFEFDWQCSQITALIPDHATRLKVKKLLRKAYPKIKTTYKALSTYDFGGVFGMSMNVICEFLSSNSVFDKLYQDSDFGVNWNAVRLNSQHYLYNPVHSLVRYEFLELLVRIAKDKYLRRKTEPSMTRALKRLLRLLKNGLTTFNFNDWKIEYFTEKMDRVITDNKALLSKVFEKYSAGKSFITLEQFTTLCMQLNMTPELSTLRDIGKSYAFAMMTTVDEVNSKRHMEMRVLEFYEALTRVLHKYPLCIGDKLAPLHKKLAHAMPYLRSLIDNNSRLLRFPTMPTRLRRSRTKHF